MDSAGYERLKSRYAQPDGLYTLAAFGRAMKMRAQERASAASASKEAQTKSRLSKQGDNLRAQATVKALDRAEKHAIETGARGGKYFMSESGEKVYVKD
jgi:hypothetical protein